MLRMWLLVVLSLLVGVSMHVPGVAVADRNGGGTDWEGRVRAEDPGAPGQGGSSGRVSGSKLECTFHGEVVPCTRGGMGWRHERECYAQSVPEEVGRAFLGESPRPGLVPMVCAGVLGGVSGPLSFFWDDPSVAPPDPAKLAQEAIKKMRLRAIDIGASPATLEADPGAYGLVGWHMWLWSKTGSADRWGPISATATAGSYSVTATAKVVKLEWDMGNGDKVVCKSTTPRTGDRQGNEKSPTCGYMYEKRGIYDISATTYWQVDWSGIGAKGGTSLELTRHATVEISEIQVVTTNDP